MRKKRPTAAEISAVMSHIGKQPAKAGKKRGRPTVKYVCEACHQALTGRQYFRVDPHECIAK